MRFHTLFYIIWGYNNTYHEIYTVGVTHISNRSKNGLRQLRRIPSIQLPCADERWSSCRLFFRKSRTCSGAISNSKGFHFIEKVDEMIPTGIQLKRVLHHFFYILIRA